MSLYQTNSEEVIKYYREFKETKSKIGVIKNRNGEFKCFVIICSDDNKKEINYYSCYKKCIYKNLKKRCISEYKKILKNQELIFMLNGVGKYIVKRTS